MICDECGNASSISLFKEGLVAPADENLISRISYTTSHFGIASATESKLIQDHALPESAHSSD